MYVHVSPGSLTHVNGRNIGVLIRSPPLFPGGEVSNMYTVKKKKNKNKTYYNTFFYDSMRNNSTLLTFVKLRI